MRACLCACMCLYRFLFCVGTEFDVTPGQGILQLLLKLLNQPGCVCAWPTCWATALCPGVLQPNPTLAGRRYNIGLLLAVLSYRERGCLAMSLGRNKVGGRAQEQELGKQERGKGRKRGERLQEEVIIDNMRFWRERCSWWRGIASFGLKYSHENNRHPFLEGSGSLPFVSFTWVWTTHRFIFNITHPSHLHYWERWG